MRRLGPGRTCCPCRRARSGRRRPFSPVAGVQRCPWRRSPAPRCTFARLEERRRRPAAIDLVDLAVRARWRRRGRRPAPARARAPRARWRRRTARPCPARRPGSTRPSLPVPMNSDPSRAGDDRPEERRRRSRRRARWPDRASAGRGCRSTGSRRRPSGSRPASRPGRTWATRPRRTATAADEDARRRATCAGSGKRHDQKRINEESEPGVSSARPEWSASARRDTAWSVGISHSPSVALSRGLKFPPLRSASSTASTDGGSDDSSSPLTTAPASRAQQLAHTACCSGAPLFSARTSCATVRGCGTPRLALLGLREPLAVRHHDRQAAARVGRNLDRNRAQHVLAAVGAQQHLERHRAAGAGPRIVDPDALERGGHSVPPST